MKHSEMDSFALWFVLFLVLAFIGLGMTGHSCNYDPIKKGSVAHE